jgi:hypothetical protein
MVIRAPAVQLLGRQRESDVLDRVLEAARDGRGGVLAVYGEPGVGKTALLDYVVEAGADFRIARTVGVEGEMELAFAALQQLCSPSLDLIERLPDPQRDASVRARRRRPGMRGMGAGGSPGQLECTRAQVVMGPARTKAGIRTASNPRCLRLPTTARRSGFAQEISVSADAGAVRAGDASSASTRWDPYRHRLGKRWQATSRSE